jgi:hypothetical protein
MSVQSTPVGRKKRVRKKRKKKGEEGKETDSCKRCLP